MVCKIFFAPISPVFQKSCGEEEDDKNRQMQSVLLFNQTQKEEKESGDTSDWGTLWKFKIFHELLF